MTHTAQFSLARKKPPTLPSVQGCLADMTKVQKDGATNHKTLSQHCCQRPGENECQYAHAGIDVAYGARNCYIIPLSRCLLCACLRSMEIWHLQHAMGQACCIRPVVVASSHKRFADYYQLNSRRHQFILPFHALKNMNTSNIIKQSICSASFDPLMRSGAFSSVTSKEPVSDFREKANGIISILRL